MIAYFDVFLYLGTKNNRVNLPHHFSYFIKILNFFALVLADESCRYWWIWVILILYFLFNNIKFFYEILIIRQLGLGFGMPILRWLMVLFTAYFAENMWYNYRRWGEIENSDGWYVYSWISKLDRLAAWWRAATSPCRSHYTSSMLTIPTYRSFKLTLRSPITNSGLAQIIC